LPHSPLGIDRGEGRNIDEIFVMAERKAAFAGIVFVMFLQPTNIPH
jgi:hypothetical protein